MSSGFNTDVRVGDQVFHVQTEDRGPSRPVIDTAVYQSGRVLLRRSSNYEQFAASPAFTAEALRERVERQHSSVIDGLRSGALAAEMASPAGGIQVQLLNPASWLSAGRVLLEVEILGRADQRPQPGAHVEAVIEGALADALHTGTTDEAGRVKIQFSLPPLGSGDLALLITAKTDAGRDEIRFAMRSRGKAPPAGAAPSAPS